MLRVPFETLGEYKLIRRIGVGGMGAVYLAYQESLDRNVAIEILRPGHFATGEAEKRLRHEALAVAQLKHPNIVTIYGAGLQAGVFLCSDGTSRRRRARRRDRAGAGIGRGACAERLHPVD